jgi:hypothetical protein
MSATKGTGGPLADRTAGRHTAGASDNFREGTAVSSLGRDARVWAALGHTQREGSTIVHICMRAAVDKTQRPALALAWGRPDEQSPLLVSLQSTAPHYLAPSEPPASVHPLKSPPPPRPPRTPPRTPPPPHSHSPPDHPTSTPGRSLESEGASPRSSHIQHSFHAVCRVAGGGPREEAPAGVESWKSARSEQGRGQDSRRHARRKHA